jgi:hypothetical protein
MSCGATASTSGTGGRGYDVAAIGGSGSKKLRHPRLGPVEYSHTILQVADNPDYTLVTYSPAAPPAPGPQGELS